MKKTDNTKTQENKANGNANKINTWIDLVALEHIILKFWNDNDTFNKLRKIREKSPHWSFIDGPITANNPMGVHHAWGRTLKDAFQRYWAMNDRSLRYQNGFDCQGLWVEVEVEKELGFKTKRDIEDYGIDKFVNKCKERVIKFSGIQTDQSIRLGYWMDWNDSYYTMSETNNYSIWAFLKKCNDRGLIYKGEDVMPWCPRCGTGISQHEMHEGYVTITHPSVYIKFPVTGKDKEAILIWTTTPWTLTSNVAAAVNPDETYVKAKQDGWTYYLIEGRAEHVLGLKGKYEILEKLPGEKLLNLTYSGPFDELPLQKDVKKPHRVIPWKDVSDKEGTGVVHIAPGCGKEDYELSKEFGLESIAPINDEGVFLDELGFLKGKTAHGADKDIFKSLEDKEIMFAVENYSHAYPHCWRCKEPLLFRKVDEWFIAMEPWKEEIMDIVKQIRWIPSFGKDLELDWLKNMHDWMISKKRYWGLALPIYICEKCGDFTVIGSREELKEKAVSGWDEFDGNTPHRPWIDSVKVACDKCGGTATRIKDVGNPWLDAGIVAYSTVKYFEDRDYWKSWVPADLVLECFPGQFRNWFYSLLAMSTMMEKIPPFKTLLGHALVRDEKGDEMHKSKGNAIWFDDAVENKDMGADVMRWLFCRQDNSINVNFGYNIAREIRGKFFNTMWNCYAFLVNYTRLAEWQPPKKGIAVKDLPDYDRWILSRLQSMIIETRKGYENYTTRPMLLFIERFVDELSNWYIRNNRRRFWKIDDEKDSEMAFQTLHTVMTSLIKVVAPIIPFVTEEMYQNLVVPFDENAPESIHHTIFPKPDETIIDTELEEDMKALEKLTSLGLAARKSANAKVRQPLAKLTIGPANDIFARAVDKYSDLLKEYLNVKEVEIKELNSPKPIKYVIKPNFATLGKRLGKLLNPLKKYIQENEEMLADKVLKKETIELKLEQEPVELTHEDFLLEEQKPENTAVAYDQETWIALDLVLTEDLRQEGIMRDMLRKMQALRKDIGLEIEDRIVLGWESSSPVYDSIFEKWGDYIDKELLCIKRLNHETFDSVNSIEVSKEQIEISIKKS